jgi:hypothetical protein
MRRIFLPIPILLTCAAAASSPAAAAEQRYSLTDFDRIQVEGPYQVVLTTGVPTSGRATGPRDAIDRVVVEVQGRTLRVHANRSAWGGYPGGGAGGIARIELSTRDLGAAGISGSGNLTIDRVRGARLDLALAGTGRLSVGQVDVDSLVVNMLGSGQIALAGRAKQIRATIQGNGDLKAAGLGVQDADVTAATSGSIALAASRSAKVLATGSGDVTIAGSPACTVQNRSAAPVRCGVRGK